MGNDQERPTNPEPRYLADAMYPRAEYMRLVRDNLNTHALAASYEVFPPAEARRIASRFEAHSTPKHGPQA